MILSSVSWKMAMAHQRAGAPHLFPFHCNELIKSFAWEKTHLISMAENWINKENSRCTVVFSIWPFNNHVKKFGSNFAQGFSFVSNHSGFRIRKARVRKCNRFARQKGGHGPRRSMRRPRKLGTRTRHCSLVTTRVQNVCACARSLFSNWRLRMRTSQQECLFLS